MDLSLFEHEYDREQFLNIAPAGKRFTMRTNEHCAWAYREATFEEYSVRLVALMAANLTCFIDAGAHHGYYSLLVGTQAPGCQIIAFEPTTENFMTMQTNLHENNLTGAKTYPYALSNVAQTKDFYISTASDNCGFIAHPATPTQKTVQMQSYPLDHFRAEMRPGPTLIKIDTEGHELEVLEGMQEIINTTPDLKLLVEFNPKLLKIAGHAPHEMLHKLDALGFDLYLLSDTENLFFRLSKDSNWEDYLPGNAAPNILCIRKDAALNLFFFSHSAQLNGAERSLLEQVQHFINRGNMCTVALHEAGPLAGLLKASGAAVVTGEFHWWCDPEPVDQQEQMNRLDKSFRWLLQTEPLFRRINPDIFFTNTTVLPWGALAAMLTGKPHIWSVTEFGEASNLQFFIPFEDVIPFIVTSSNFILTNSNAVKKALFADLEPHQVETIYRFIQLPEETPTPAVDIFTRPGAVRLIQVGTIIKLKRQHDAVLAVAELVNNQKKDVELVIIGAMPAPNYYNELLELIAQNNLQQHIHLIDFQENIFPLLRQADIALTCSHIEPLGRTTLEAMLCGKPVVGVNGGGTPELLEDGVTGLLYKAGDPLALAEKIAWLYDHPEQRREMGQNGLDQAHTRFTLETTYERVHYIARAIQKQTNPAANEATKLFLNLFKNKNIIDLQTSEGINLRQQPEISELTHQKEFILEQLNNKEAELAAIYQSKAWRVILLYRSIKNLFLKK